jgi:hypothetical protein
MRHHAAGICDCCDAPTCPGCGELVEACYCEVEVALTRSDVALLRSALDSYEYWEHRDELPHDSGYITVQDDADFEAQCGVANGDANAAWFAVKQARALESKLADAVREDDDV